MPTQSLEIVEFTAGLISGVADEEVPENACADGTLNIDPDAPEGRLTGRYDDTSITAQDDAGNLEINDNILFAATLPTNSASSVDVLFSYLSTTYRLWYIEDWPKGETCAEITTTVPGITHIYPIGRYARVGATTPQFVGKLEYDHYWTSPSGNFGWIAADAKMTTNGLLADDTDGTDDPVFTEESSGTTYGGLVKGRTYYWKFALIYDGSQIGPMYPANDFDYSSTMVNDYGIMKIKPVVCVDPANAFAIIPKRATDIAIFRSEAPARSDGSAEPTTNSAFYYVGKISFVTESWTASGLNTPENRIASSYFMDYGQTGPTFEELSGYPELLTDPSVAYNYSAVVNSKLCAIQCTKTEYGTEANYMMFVSEPLKYDTFNYLTKFVRLPFYPVAVASFGNRCLVFGRYAMCRIDVENLLVEDVVQGIGALSQDVVLQTDEALFFMDTKSPYMYVNGQIKPIGLKVMASFQVWAASGTFSVKINAATKSVLFCKHEGTQVSMFVYHTLRDRWDYHTMSGGFMSQNNVSVYGANGKVTFPYKNSDLAIPAVREYGTSATRVGTWYFYSKMHHMGMPSQNKFLTIIRARTGGTATVNWSLDGGSYTGSLTAGTAAKTVKIKVTGSTTDAKVEDYAIIYRPPVGRR